MNTKRVKKLAETIRNAKNFDLQHYCYNEDYRFDGGVEDIPAEDLLHNCQTVGCVAGFCCSLYAPKETICFHYKACKALELTKSQSDNLFLAGPDSVWVKFADTFDWQTNRDGLIDWGEVTADQAAFVLEKIADNPEILN